MRTFWIVAGIFFFFVGLPAAGAGAYFWRFYAPVPQARYAEPQDAAEARRQDLDFLLRLPEVDRSFSDEEKARFLGHVSQLMRNVETLTEPEFAMGVAAAVAITENGHTKIGTRSLARHLNSLPVRFFWFGDGLHIVRAHETHADLIGARVVSYDGASPDALLEQLHPYSGGNEHFLRFESPFFIASPAAMHAAGLAQQPDRVTLTLSDADGNVRDVVIEAEERATPPVSVSDLALPIASARESESSVEWRFVEPNSASGAYYARNPGRVLWSDTLPNGGAYIRLREIADDSETSLGAWLGELQERFRVEPANYLVLDLRSNGGGDLTRTMSFARNITDLVVPAGRVYILTDGGTFSAAIVTAAYALNSAGERGFVVGTHIGDDEQFWAEGGGVLRLPNSGLSIGIATGYHDWENGCTSYVRCYWLSAAMGVAAGPLDPDIEAPLTYADYVRGVDTTVQAVLDAEAAAIRTSDGNALR